MFEIIRSVKDLKGRKAQDFSVRVEPTDALLCEPSSFDIIDVKNPHMEGQIGAVDKEKASQQWRALREAIVKAGHRVRLVEPTPGLEDMVFTANPVLPGIDSKGDRVCLLSNMKHPSRKKEVAAHRKWFESRGYRIVNLSRPEWNFEGQGDALWHPGRNLLWGGYGFRSVPEAYEEVGQIFESAVVLIRLVDEAFYHLDTCLCVISETVALYAPNAFDADGRALIEALFPDAIEVPQSEAKEGFACNALALGKTVLIQQGNVKTTTELTQRGLNVVQLETSEFMKSGGSVFCMKMMVYSD